MDFAIIRVEGSLLMVVKLSNWQEHEWEDFAVLRSTEGNDIKWFSTQSEAVNFMLNNFSHEAIRPVNLKLSSNDDKYYIS